MGFHFKEGKSLLANLLDKVLTIADDVVCAEAVAIATFRVAVIFIKSGAHVYSRMEVAAVGLVDGLNLAAGDTSEHSAGHRVSQSYELRENGVELFSQ